MTLLRQEGAWADAWCLRQRPFAEREVARVAETAHATDMVTDARDLLKPEGPRVVRIRDINVWKALLKEIGRENSYYIGCIVNIAAVQAKKERTVQPDPRLKMSHRPQRRPELPAHQRFRVFIYDPFDKDGFTTYHELVMHYAMCVRNPRVVSARSRDTLFTYAAGTEVHDVHRLRDTVQRFSDAETFQAFETMVRALRQYPSVDLSKELFAWIGVLRRYPDYEEKMRRLLHERGGEDRKHLEGHMARRSGLVKATREFIEAAKRHPVIMTFLDGYYAHLGHVAGSPLAVSGENAMRQTASSI